MTLIPLILLCGTLLLHGQERASEARFANVRVIVADTFGQPIQKFSVSIVPITKQAAGAVPITITASGIVRLRIGEYEIRGEASRHNRYVRKVKIDQEEMVLPVAFAPAHYGHSEVVESPLVGRIEGFEEKSGEQYWLKITSIWGGLQQESLISNDGSFRFDGVPSGEYLALVFRGRELVACRTPPQGDAKLQDEANLRVIIDNSRRLWTRARSSSRSGNGERRRNSPPSLSRRLANRLLAEGHERGVRIGAENEKEFQ